MRAAWLVFPLVLASTAPGQAHLVNSGFGPFYDGSVHPLMSPEDLLPVAAVTMLAGLSGARYGRWLLAVLPAAWMIGMAAGWAFVLPVVPLWVSAGTTAVAGFALAADARLPLAATVGFAATVGLLHGVGNGTELAVKPGGFAIAGTACCLAAIVSLLVGQVTSLRARWARLAVRVSGSWIAAVGILMLGWSTRA